MFNIIIILLGTLNDEPLGSTDYRIARYLLSHLNNLSSLNISKVASECYVSASSVSRFCKKVGFQDFNNLNAQFIQYPFRLFDKFNYNKFSPTNIQNSYLDAAIENLQLLKSSLNRLEVEELVEDICSYDYVAAFGTLHSQSVVLNLQTDLLSSGIVMDTRTQFIQQQEYLENACQKTLVILFSREGAFLQRFLQNLLELKRANKPKIVMITTNEHKKKDKYIDKVICYKENGGFSAYPFAFEAIGNVLSLEVAKKKGVLN
ncbi:MAG: MurR/RpiR family transcriptional regulator [Streptococcaceae bacterium]|jgi:DNA-binding MurR/RpiR family transcriptional regulator|nr:MurR/RpiR family transcriptional regulator [Streptococcaceae bacterium]